MVPTKEMKEMRAFHNDPKIKAKYLKRVKAHAKADEIIRGRYWENGKGCAVGCTIEGNQHNRYETELGIPEAIARLEDTLFEIMPAEDAMKFPVRFLEAVPVGADLSLVPAKLIVFILDDALRVKEVKEDKVVTTAVKDVRDLWQKTVEGKEVESAAWSAAESVAESVVWSVAESVAWSAAESVVWSAARSAARSVAWSVAWSAASNAARSAASNAARSAAESVAWSVARSATESAAGLRYGNALLELIKQAPTN
jgi:hypothetical protein